MRLDHTKDRELTERQRDQRWIEALREENLRLAGGTKTKEPDPVHMPSDDWGGVKL